MRSAARAQLLVEGGVEWRCDLLSPGQHVRADYVRIKQRRAQLLVVPASSPERPTLAGRRHFLQTAGSTVDRKALHDFTLWTGDVTPSPRNPSKPPAL